MKGFEHHPSDWVEVNVWTEPDGTPHQSVRFAVNGQPIQKGNIIKSKWGKYHDATKGIEDWVRMVQTVSRAAMNNGYGKRMAARRGVVIKNVHADPVPLFDGPVLLEVTLVRERLKKHGTKDAPPHTSKPDLDKLVRGICDGLTGIVYNDDSQVVKIVACKRFAHPGERPGAAIFVSSRVEVP